MGDHFCPYCGEHHGAMEEAPVAAEVVADVSAEEAGAAVQIAEIEADRDIRLAKIAAAAEETHDETEVEVLRAEVRTLREMIEKIVPEPEPTTPEPVIVAQEVPAPEPEPEMPKAEDRHEPRAPKVKRGFF